MRRKVFTEVARLAYEGGDYTRMEDLPYKIVPGDVAIHRESIFLERAIVEERLRLAMGLPLRSVSEHAPVSKGVNESAIAEKYYDPPLVNIISFACNACPTMHYHVTDVCQGCFENPCKEVCPKGAINIRHGKSIIDQDKCINADDARTFAHITPFLRWSVPAQEPAEWTLSAAMSTAGRR